jgi:hypothetical protein
VSLWPRRTETAFEPEEPIVGDKTDANVRAGAAPFLEPGEQIVAMLFAQPRGHSQAMAGGVAGMVGGKRSGGARRDAEAAGVELADTMVLTLTLNRLLMMETGNAGKVKRLLGAYPLAEVGAMEVKRLGLGGSVTLTIRDTAVKLEARVGASREFADEIERAKAA